MTCIAGMAEGGTVWMGGDSCGSSVSPGWVNAQKISGVRPKIFARQGLLFGYTSSFRMGQLLEFSLEIPGIYSSVSEISEDELCGYMHRQFIDAVRACFAKGGYGKLKDGREEEGGTFLVGALGHLFMVQNDFAIHESSHGFFCVGSGAEVATGAMHAGAQVHKPSERVLVALRAAAAHATGVEAPFTILTLRHSLIEHVERHP